MMLWSHGAVILGETPSLLPANEKGDQGPWDLPANHTTHSPYSKSKGMPGGNLES